MQVVTNGISSTGKNVQSNFHIIPEERKESDTNLNERIQELNGYGTEDGEEFHEDDKVCNFCGRADPNFSADTLDLHYWKDCPMLTRC